MIASDQTWGRGLEELYVGKTSRLVWRSPFLPSCDCEEDELGILVVGWLIAKMIKHRVRRVVGKTSRLVRRSPLGVETITQRGASGPRPVFTDLPMRGRSWGGGGGGGKRRFGNDYWVWMGLKRLWREEAGNVWSLSNNNASSPTNWCPCSGCPLRKLLC